METQLLQEFGIAGGRPLPPGRPAEAHSPETRVALHSLYASMDDNTNKCAHHQSKFLSIQFCGSLQGPAVLTCCAHALAVVLGHQILQLQKIKGWPVPAVLSCNADRPVN